MAKNWLILIIVLVLSLACGVATPTPTEEPAEEVVVETEAPTEPPVTEKPIATEAPTELPPTEEPALSQVEGCVELLYPDNAVEVPAVGKVTFEWTALAGADTYLLTFALPSGETVDFEADGTTRDRYMEAFSKAGEYQWNVTVLTADGSQICSSTFFAFTKPQLPGNAPKGDGGGGIPTMPPEEGGPEG